MKMAKQNNQKNNLLIFIKNYWALILVGIVVFSFLYVGVNRFIKSFLIEKYGITIKAGIINEENYYGNSPISKEFSYSYQFKIGDKTYKGIPWDSKLKIGDSILIEYASCFPIYNRPVKKGK